MLALKRLPLAVMPRRGPNVQATRKVYASECWQQNLSWQDIQKEDRIMVGVTTMAAMAFTSTPSS